MGCVFGREARPRSAAAAAAAPAPDAERKGEDGLSSLSISKSQSKLCNVEGGVVVALEASRAEDEEEVGDGSGRAEVNGGSGSRPQRQRKKPNPRLSNPPKHVQGEQAAAGWPPWLVEVAGEAIKGWIPRRADTFQKLDKVITLLPSNFTSPAYPGTALISVLIGFSLARASWSPDP